MTRINAGIPNQLTNNKNKVMSTEIKVKASPNTSSSRIFTFDIRDMGYTPEEWEALPDNERQSAIQKELDGEPEQPYWEFDEIID